MLEEGKILVMTYICKNNANIVNSKPLPDEQSRVDTQPKEDRSEGQEDGVDDGEFVPSCHRVHVVGGRECCKLFCSWDIHGMSECLVHI